MRNASFSSLGSRVVSFAAGVAIVASASAARANGRFPESSAIFFAPNDPEVVLLRTTFGLISSRDRGKTWDWVCERSVGLAGVEDPMYAVTPDSTMIASTFQGLSVSHDKACNWSFVGGALDSLVFIDLASRPSTSGNVVAFASSYAGQDDAGVIFFKSTLFETTDQGKSFNALPANLSPELLGETVDVTPSDPDRIYVSAVRDPDVSTTAWLLTSIDHGKSFVEHSIPLVQSEHGAFIAAVDPINADRVYVRTSNAVDQPSRLLVSDDAGKTFRTVFTAKGPPIPRVPQRWTAAAVARCARRRRRRSRRCSPRWARRSRWSAGGAAADPARDAQTSNSAFSRISRTRHKNEFAATPSTMRWS